MKKTGLSELLKALPKRILRQNYPHVMDHHSELNPTGKGEKEVRPPVIVAADERILAAYDLLASAIELQEDWARTQISDEHRDFFDTYGRFPDDAEDLANVETQAAA